MYGLMYAVHKAIMCSGVYITLNNAGPQNSGCMIYILIYVSLLVFTIHMYPVHVFYFSGEPPEPDNCFDQDWNKGVLEEDEFRSLWSTATSFIFLFLFSLTYSAVLSFFKVIEWSLHNVQIILNKHFWNSFT